MQYAQCDIDCHGCDVGFLADADESACMTACNSTSSCVAFVAVPVLSSGKVNCTLKSVAGPGLLPHAPSLNFLVIAHNYLQLLAVTCKILQLLTEIRFARGG